MEVKIGVQNVNRELVLESPDSPEDVQQALTSALADDGGILTLTDAKGRKVMVPVSKVAYVETGTATTGTVGFRS